MVLWSIGMPQQCIIGLQITPSVDSAMFFFGTNALHFSEEFYGTVLLIDGIAQVLGAPFSLAVLFLCSCSDSHTDAICLFTCEDLD